MKQYYQVEPEMKRVVQYYQVEPEMKRVVDLQRLTRNETRCWYATFVRWAQSNQSCFINAVCVSQIFRMWRCEIFNCCVHRCRLHKTTNSRWKYYLNWSDITSVTNGNTRFHDSVCDKVEEGLEPEHGKAFTGWNWFAKVVYCHRHDLDLHSGKAPV